MTLMLALLTPDAAACGGFFCNNIEPVKQKGETIVFEVDGEEDRTTMHVQVEYQGPASEFAWVIPVKGEPNLALSNDALFSQLDPRTRPTFEVLNSEHSTCGGWWAMPELDNNAFDPSSPPGVDVIAEQQVGPYDTAVLAAQDTEALLSWLQSNGYAVPDGMGPVMAPYLADGHNFVALKLTSGNSTGDLEPLAMQYSGTVASIPLHLTSVAAEEDMPITTYVLADSRVVPDNYLHVEINLAAIDWFDLWAGDNYAEVVTRAADQAGGHAFATDYSGPTSELVGRFYPEGVLTSDYDIDSAEGFLEAVTDGTLPPSRDLMNALDSILSIPADIDARSVYNCPNCFSGELLEWHPVFDGAAAAAQLDASILQPLRDIEAMFDRQPHLTRLSSSVSPHEMTLDPMFVANSDIPQLQSRFHTATILSICEEEVPWEETPATLILENGLEIELPSYQTMQDHGISTWSEYLDRLGEPAASRIESFGPSGPPTVLFDGMPEIVNQIDDLNDDTDHLEKRGCSTAGSGTIASLLVLPALLGLRRR